MSAAPGAQDSFGRYELAAEITRGGLGPLSVGRVGAGEGAGRAVLLRRFDRGPLWDPALLEAVTAAAARVEGIHHPSLLAVLGSVPAPDRVVVATEYVEGLTLAELMARARARKYAIPVHSALRVAEEIARSLVAAREALAGVGAGAPLTGVQPESVIVTSGDDALLADLSLVALDRVPDHPQLVAYRAPELLKEGGTAGESAAVYAIGLILWEMLAGREAFAQSSTGATANVVRMQALKGAIPRLDRVARELPALAVELVMQSLRQDPSSRYPSISAFAAALAAVGEGPRTGALVRLIGDLGAGLIELQRQALASGEQVASSWRPTLRPNDPDGPEPTPTRARKIGLAAFAGRQPDALEPSIATEAPLGIEVSIEPVVSSASAPLGASLPVGNASVQAHRPDSGAKPAALPPYREQAPTVPLLLVQRAPDATSFATEPGTLPGPAGALPRVAADQRTEHTASNAGAVTFDRVSFEPPPRRRWGLLVFVLLVFGACMAVGVVAMLEQLEPPKDASPPLIPPIASAGAELAASADERSAPPGVKGTSDRDRGGVTREGRRDRNEVRRGNDEPEPEPALPGSAAPAPAPAPASAPAPAPPHVREEKEPSLDNPYTERPDPPPAPPPPVRDRGF